MKNSTKPIRFAPLAKIRQPKYRIVSEDGDVAEFSTPGDSPEIPSLTSDGGPPAPLVWPPLGDAGIRDTDPPEWVTVIILLAMAIGILSLMAAMLWSAK